jgi:hypothetical protein
MRLLGVGLANTESGSILVTKTWVTHLQMNEIIQPPVVKSVPKDLPMPDWSLLHLLTPLSTYKRPDCKGNCRLASLGVETSKVWQGI